MEILPYISLDISILLEEDEAGGAGFPHRPRVRFQSGHSGCGGAHASLFQSAPRVSYTILPRIEFHVESTPLQLSSICGSCHPHGTGWRDLTGATYMPLDVDETLRGEDTDRVERVTRCRWSDSNRVMRETQPSETMMRGETNQGVSAPARAGEASEGDHDPGKRFNRGGGL